MKYRFLMEDENKCCSILVVINGHNAFHLTFSDIFPRPPSSNLGQIHLFMEFITVDDFYENLSVRSLLTSTMHRHFQPYNLGDDDVNFQLSVLLERIKNKNLFNTACI
ncbi:hypothetical protein VNO80_06218 [Phaseolus coccineus]|uniref:Uncharacterized protein n=1 Tax=Phaseolus coccineus TaxID=3886 RepID=A0AAN9REB8_PHACN